MYLVFYRVLLIFSIFTFCYLLSKDKENINWRKVIQNLCIHIFCLFLIKLETLKNFFSLVQDIVMCLAIATDNGTGFILGEVFYHHKNSLLFQGIMPLMTFTIIVTLISSFNSFGKIIKKIGSIFTKILLINPVMGVYMFLKLFVGQIESIVLVQKLIKYLDRKEILMVMMSGMATSSIGAALIYEKILEESLASHILFINMLNIPIVISLANILMPQERIYVQGEENFQNEQKSLFESLEKGIQNGWNLVINISLMLFTVTTLLKILDFIITGIGKILFIPLNLEIIISFFVMPIFILIFPEIDISTISDMAYMFGTKIFGNEMIALNILQKLNFDMPLKIFCINLFTNFGNLSSVAIQVSTLSNLVKDKETVAKVSIIALLGALLSNIVVALTYSIIIL